MTTFLDITKIKETKEALRASEETYRALINGMNDTAWVVDLNAKFIDVNDAAVKILGYSREELLSMGSADIDSSLSAEEINKLIKNMPADHIQVFETSHTTKDGRKIPVEISSSLVKYHGKQAILSIARDITERKKMELELKESEEKYRTQFEEALDAIILADAETGIILDCNRAATELFERDKTELIGQHQRILHPPSELEGNFSKTFTKHTKNKAGKVLVTKAITKSGAIRDVAIKANFINVQGRKILEGVFRDITESKKARNALRNSEEKFRAISNSVRDAIVLVNDKEIIEYWNPAAEKTFGYTREEAVGRKVHELVVPSSFCPEAKIAMAEGVAQFAQTGKGNFITQTMELTAARKDGIEFPIKLSLSPIKLGNKWHAIGVAKDITEQKQNEQMAREYSEKLEKAITARTSELQAAQANLLKLERLAAIGELAGMVGHDLRNPLTGIKNAAYYLRVKEASKLGDNGKKMLGIIDNAIMHADKIIGDLQDYAREMHLDLTKCTPRSILKETWHLIRVPEKIHIVDHTQEKPLIRADKTRMTRVFINLIKNAIDAMPEGGTLKIKSIQENGNVKISFTDTGKGIPKDTLRKLFSPLVTTKAQGMGFGLAICKRIIEAHQGKITVHTKEGKGSTFTIIIPIEPKLKNGGDPTWINLPESLLSTTTKT